MYVHGNHDGRYRTEGEPGGCICVDDQVYVWKGLRIMGLGGSIRYNCEETFQYTEQEMRRRVRRLWFKAHRAGGIDLLLTHSPAAGLNDGDDRAHKGFACFNDLLEEYRPKWFVHGHVHLNYDANLPRVCTHGQTTASMQRSAIRLRSRTRTRWPGSAFSGMTRHFPPKTEKGETPNGTK